MQSKARSAPHKLIIIGDLQLAIMRCVWSYPNLPLHRIHQNVRHEYKDVSLTAVSTTLYRLLERKWVLRTGSNRHSRYLPGISRAELIEMFMVEIDAI
jgi:predicted transcriptional regulator